MWNHMEQDCSRNTKAFHARFHVSTKNNKNGIFVEFQFVRLKKRSLMNSTADQLDESRR